MNSKELIKELEGIGYKLDRVKGSHHIIYTKEGSPSIPVPHPKKDLSQGTVRSIRKRAGLI